MRGPIAALKVRYKYGNYGYAVFVRCLFILLAYIV